MVVRVLSIKQEDDYSLVFACNKEGSVLKLKSVNRIEKDWINRFAIVVLDGDKLLAITSTEEQFELKTDKKVVSKLYEGVLVKAMQSISYGPLKKTTQVVLSSDEFKIIPSSLRYHDRYERFPGGNVVHTAMAASTAMSLLKLDEYKDVSADIVLAAIIWHDFGKTYSYDIRDDGFFERDFCDRLISHVASSFGEFWAAAMVCGVDRNIAELVGHCILASHGRKDWGAAVLPETPEAWLVHMSDMLGSRVANSNLFFESKDKA